MRKEKLGLTHMSVVSSNEIKLTLKYVNVVKMNKHSFRIKKHQSEITKGKENN